MHTRARSAELGQYPPPRGGGGSRWGWWRAAAASLQKARDVPDFLDLPSCGESRWPFPPGHVASRCVLADIPLWTRAQVAERGAPYSTGRAHEQLGGGGGADGGGGRKSLSLSRDRVEFKRARDKAQHAAAAQAAAEEAAAVAVESLRAAMSVGVSGGEGGEGADERGEPRDWSERASFY